MSANKPWWWSPCDVPVITTKMLGRHFERWSRLQLRAGLLLSSLLERTITHNTPSIIGDQPVFAWCAQTQWRDLVLDYATNPGLNKKRKLWCSQIQRNQSIPSCFACFSTFSFYIIDIPWYFTLLVVLHIWYIVSSASRQRWWWWRWRWWWDDRCNK
jgi:hypothetical protein